MTQENEVAGLSGTTHSYTLLYTGIIALKDNFIVLTKTVYAYMSPSTQLFHSHNLSKYAKVYKNNVCRYMYIYICMYIHI